LPELSEARLKVQGDRGVLSGKKKKAEEGHMIFEIIRYMLAALFLLVLAAVVIGGIILVLWIFYLVFGITVS